MKPARLMLADGRSIEIDLDEQFLKMSFKVEEGKPPVPIMRLDLGTPFLDCEMNRIYENDFIEGYPEAPVRMGEKTGQWESPYTTDKDGSTIYGAIPGEIGRPPDEAIEAGAPARISPPYMLNIKVSGVKKV